MSMINVPSSDYISPVVGTFGLLPSPDNELPNFSVPEACTEIPKPQAARNSLAAKCCFHFHLAMSIDAAVGMQYN